MYLNDELHAMRDCLQGGIGVVTSKEIHPEIPLLSTLPKLQNAGMDTKWGTFSDGSNFCVGSASPVISGRYELLWSWRPVFELPRGRYDFEAVMKAVNEIIERQDHENHL